MLSTTVDTLCAFMAAGGRVFVVGNPGPYVDGLVNRSAYDKLKRSWEECDLASLDEHLNVLIGRRIISDTAFPS